MTVSSTGSIEELGRNQLRAQPNLIEARSGEASHRRTSGGTAVAKRNGFHLTSATFALAGELSGRAFAVLGCDCEIGRETECRP